MNKNLERLKSKYMDIEIPSDLDDVVNKALNRSRKKNRTPIKILVGSGAVAALLMVVLNTNPVLAKSLSDVPVIGNVINVMTFVEYKVDDEKHHANIKVPSISNLKDKDLEKSLNEKYLKENKQLYQEFLQEVESLQKQGDGHIGVESGYVIKTDNEKILSIGRYVVDTVGSSSTTFKYDTIDKKKHLILTLPILFENQNYIEKISENIKDQMKQQMKEDKTKVYWILDAGVENPIDPFEKITANHNFYINQENKLVISFDKYEVAPGYMGVVEFIIPTELLYDDLLGSEYIK
ncbi:RsiV family protein [Neobacillus sp. CF12]|uniref:RsiV family protein n=1 Tax=Neobacillus sp. CF12 TaxID=3055864 RepID=UPI0025A1ACBC|nr:RsiV family protein [Neobacillus sp. CF12]MDM5326221.1 RsiV family protein [Neobacillus sp. CF12]